MAADAEGPGFVGIRFCQVRNYFFPSFYMIFAIKLSKTVMFLTSEMKMNFAAFYSNFKY